MKSRNEKEYERLRAKLKKAFEEADKIEKGELEAKSFPDVESLFEELDKEDDEA